MLQHVQKRYGISGQEKARLGQVWQPWYADLLKQGNLTGTSSLCLPDAIQASASAVFEAISCFYIPLLA